MTNDPHQPCPRRSRFGRGMKHMEIKKPLRLSLVVQLTGEIERLIANNVWQVGMKIPGELELAEQFGVSRGTMREALQSLVSAGVIETRQGAGAYIISQNRYNASMKKRLEGASISEILEVRLFLETQIAAAAAQRRTKDDLNTLKFFLQQRNELFSARAQNDYEDKGKYVEADRRFHFEIAEICKNRLLYDLYESLFSFLADLFGEHYMHDRRDRQNILHVNLYDAIEAGESERAVLAIEELVEEEKNFFIRINQIESKER